MQIHAEHASCIVKEVYLVKARHLSQTPTFSKPHGRVVLYPDLIYRHEGAYSICKSSGTGSSKG